METYEREYARRWIVEHTFSWLGNFRPASGGRGHHEPLLGVYHGFILLAFVLICLGRILE